MRPDKKKRLLGIEALGARLRELRLKSGLSQMKLAGKMGFNPTHGYKYVLRIEKGLVPNPTLRTIVAFLEACGAGWKDLTDILPGIGSGPAAATPSLAAAARTGRKPGRKPGKTRTKQPEPPEPTAIVPRDPRPLRVRRRSELISRRAERTQQYWTRVSEAEDAVTNMLGSLHVLSSVRHDYVAFVRPCCSVVQSSASTGRRTVERELTALVRSAAAKGLDQTVLLRVKDICLEHFKTEENPRT